MYTIHTKPHMCVMCGTERLLHTGYVVQTSQSLNTQSSNQLGALWTESWLYWILKPPLHSVMLVHHVGLSSISFYLQVCTNVYLLLILSSSVYKCLSPNFIFKRVQMSTSCSLAQFLSPVFIYNSPICQCVRNTWLVSSPQTLYLIVLVSFK